MTWLTSDTFTVCKVAKTSRGEAVLISILAFLLVFHAITFGRSGFRKITNQASMALNPLVSVCGHLAVCNARISADKHTHINPHTPTDQVP